MFFNKYPYTDFHELNLSWVIATLTELDEEIKKFVSLNAIKYADPIQWDITRQYETNTVVIDPLTGTACISVQPVPSGVSLTNTDYWTVVFDLGSFVVRASKNFTSRYEEETTQTATFPSDVGDWLVWGDVLYKAKTPIVAGDQYVVDSNIEHFTIEDLYKVYLDTIEGILDIVGDLDDLTTSDKTSIVTAINSVVTDFGNIIGNLDNLTTEDKSSIVAAINELVSTGGGSIEMIGDLDDLNTDDKSNVVAAINEVLTDVENTSNKLDELPKFLYTVDLAQEYEIKATQGTYKIIQGCFKCSDGNYIVSFTDENNTNGIIAVYDASGNLLRSNTLYIMHANGVTLEDGKIYVSYGRSDTNSGVIIDYTTLSILDYINIAGANHTVSSFKFYDGVCYAWASNGNFGSVDLTTPSAATFTVLFNYYPSGTIQDFTVSGDHVFFDSVNAQQIVVFDLDGNFVQAINIKPLTSGLVIGEIETIQTIDEDVYIFITSYGISRVWQKLRVFKTNFVKNALSDITYYTPANTRASIDCHVDMSYTGISLGTSDKPFKSIDDAIDYMRSTYPSYSIELYLASGNYPEIVINGGTYFIKPETGASVSIAGIAAYRSDVLIDGVTIDGVAVNNAGIYASDSHFVILNTVFDSFTCDYCIFFNAAVATVTNLTFNTPSIIPINASTGSQIFCGNGVSANSIRLGTGSYGFASSHHYSPFIKSSDYCGVLSQCPLFSYTQNLYVGTKNIVNTELNLDYYSELIVEYLFNNIHHRASFKLDPNTGVVGRTFELSAQHIDATPQLIIGICAFEIQNNVLTVLFNRRAVIDSAGTITYSTKTDNITSVSYIAITQVFVK